VLVNNSPISTKLTIISHSDPMNAKKDNHDIWRWKSIFWLRTGTRM